MSDKGCASGSRIVIVAVAAVLMFVAPLTFGWQATGSVTVKVADDDQDPLRNVEVVVREAATGEVVAESSSNNVGVAEVTELEFSEYEVVVENDCRATSPAFSLDEQHPHRDVVFVLAC